MIRAKTPQPTTVAQQPARVQAPTSGPVALDPQQLKHVAGGAPKGGWTFTVQSAAAPKGGW